MSELGETIPAPLAPAGAAPLNGTPALSQGAAEAKVRFAKALEEARAGATALGSALGKEAQDRAGLLRGQIEEKREDLIEEAKVLGEQAKEKGAEFAETAKAKTSEALSGLSRLATDQAATVDEKVGVKYGDLIRTAAKSVDDFAGTLDTKSYAELGEDAKAMIRKNPAAAVGIAAAAGFVLARIFGGGSKD